MKLHFLAQCSQKASQDFDRFQGSSREHPLLGFGSRRIFSGSWRLDCESTVDIRAIKKGWPLIQMEAYKSRLEDYVFPLGEADCALPCLLVGSPPPHEYDAHGWGELFTRHLLARQGVPYSPVQRINLLEP